MQPSPTISWWRRVAWLIFIWAAGVSVLAVLAYLLRLLMNAAGLTTTS